jgi:hypothetical protein
VFDEKPVKKHYPRISPNNRQIESYESKAEHIQFAIDCFACYYSIYKTWKAVLEKFKSDENFTISMSTIKDYRTKFLSLIMERRKQLMKEIPILDPTQRWQYAQELYDMATVGVEVYSNTGKSYQKRDVQAGVAALKLAHEMAGKDLPGEESVSDDEIVRTVVREAFENTKKDHPEWDNKKVAEYLIEQLPVSATPYIEELGSTV